MNFKITIFAFLLFINVLSLSSSAQCTTWAFPGTTLFYPDTTSTLDPAAATDPYEAVIQINIPQSIAATIGGFPVTATIDSIKLVNVTGLPSGFTYSTDNGTGIWQNNTRGCISISGTPTNAQVGNYIINFDFACGIVGMATPYSLLIGKYKLQIKDSTNVGLEEITEITEGIYRIYPNPVQKSTTIEFNASASKHIHVEIVNIIGSQVFAMDRSVNQGINSIKIERGNIPSGIYFVRINDGEKKYIQKIVLN